jgi:hypothetical protein
VRRLLLRGRAVRPIVVVEREADRASFGALAGALVGLHAHGFDAPLGPS